MEGGTCPLGADLGGYRASLEPTREASVNCGCERHILLCETVFIGNIFIGTIFIGHLYKGTLCAYNSG